MNPTQQATMLLSALASDVRDLERLAVEYPEVAFAECDGLRELIDRMASVVVHLTKDRAA